MDDRVTCNTMKYNASCIPPDFLGSTLSWKEIAETLWGLLDDIDTQPDMLKPCNYRMAELCWKRMVKIAEQRHRYLISDGYGLSKGE